jgi:type IV secretion system protein VirB1
MTIAAAMALIATNRCVPPPVAPIIVGISQPESGLDPLAIHDNQTGRAYAPATTEEAKQIASVLLSQHHDLDLGIAQVNIRNFGWTGVSLQTAFLPCAHHSLLVRRCCLLSITEIRRTA